VFKDQSNEKTSLKACDDVESLRNEIRHLQTKLDSLSSNLNITNNNNNCNNNTINVHVSVCTPHNFGSENIQHLVGDIDFMRQTLKSVHSNGIVDLMSKIHFDDTFPQNQNIKLKSTKRRECSIYKNNQWNTTGITNATNLLLQQSQTLLSTHYHSDIELKSHDMNENELNIFFALPKIGMQKEKKFNSQIRKKLLQAMIDYRKNTTVKTDECISMVPKLQL